MSQKFLKKDTRASTVVLSVFLALGAIILALIGLITDGFFAVSTIGSPILVLISAIFLGSIQIRVFSDYKAQKKFLCADGIFNICLTVLISICAIVYIGVPDAKFDFRYVIFGFTTIFGIWKFIMAGIGFKNKHFNATVDLIIALLWLTSGAGIFLTTFNDLGLAIIGIYVMIASNYALILATIFYMLFSYIFKEPTFLITEKAIEIQNEEQLPRQQRLNRFNANLAGTPVEQPKEPEAKKTELTLEEKLKKLQNLKEQGFINEEEFEARKKEILDEVL